MTHQCVFLWKLKYLYAETVAAVWILLRARERVDPPGGDDPCPDPWSCDDGSGGSGDDNNNNDPSPGDDNCGEGTLPGTDDGQCVDEPDDPFEEPDPCEQADQLANGNEFINILNNLVADAMTKDFETGYLMTGTPGNYSFTFQSGDPGDPFMDFTGITQPVDGYTHSHFSGTFSTFSGQDVRAIYQLHQAGKVNNLSTFTAGVVSAAGTSYLMKIRDQQAFLNFGEVHFGDNASFENFETEYNTRRNAFLPLFGEITGSELALLSLLEENNAGIKVFKGNNNFTDWQAVETNSGNTQVVITDCN